MSNSFSTPWTIAHQAPLSMGFPRQEYWGGLPFPSTGDLPGPGIKPPSPELAGAFFATEPHGMPVCSFILSTTIYWGSLLPVLLGICGIKQKQWQTTFSSWRSHSTEWSQKINKLLQYIMLSGDPYLRESEAGEEIRECEGGKWGLIVLKSSGRLFLSDHLEEVSLWIVSGWRASRQRNQQVQRPWARSCRWRWFLFYIITFIF